MKLTNPNVVRAAVLAGALIWAPGAVAQAVSTTTTTTSAGTISEFGPDALVIRSETATEPLRYRFSKTTTYVDEAGAPVTREVLRAGLPVTVHYTKTGDEMMASKVIVKKTALPSTIEREETTTTTSTVGTISELGPEMIVIKSQTSPRPLRYSFSKSTTYVDETGAPVTREILKSGLPVTVHYTRSGDNLIASRVVVKKAAIATPPVIEERKETTTTTTTSPK